jgi:hypothetical protein
MPFLTHSAVNRFTLVFIQAYHFRLGYYQHIFKAQRIMYIDIAELIQHNLSHNEIVLPASNSRPVL